MASIYFQAGVVGEAMVNGSTVEAFESTVADMIARKGSIRCTVAFETEAERAAAVSAFAKSVRVKESVLLGDGKRSPTLRASFDFTPDGTTGEANEAGVKRAAGFLKGLRKLFA